MVSFSAYYVIILCSFLTWNNCWISVVFKVKFKPLLQEQKDLGMLFLLAVLPLTFLFIIYNYYSPSRSIAKFSIKLSELCSKVLFFSTFCSFFLFLFLSQFFSFPCLVIFQSRTWWINLVYFSCLILYFSEPSTMPGISKSHRCSWAWWMPEWKIVKCEDWSWFVAPMSVLWTDGLGLWHAMALVSPDRHVRNKECFSEAKDGKAMAFIREAVSVVNLCGRGEVCPIRLSVLVYSITPEVGVNSHWDSQSFLINGPLLIFMIAPVLVRMIFFKHLLIAQSFYRIFYL